MAHERSPTLRIAAAVLVVSSLLQSASVAAASENDSKPPAAAQPVKPGLSDPVFQQPYIDIDEWRDVPVRHRYLHGGFKGTDTRFSFYLPEKERYHGRFFQHITPVPDNENLAQKAGREKKTR